MKRHERGTPQGGVLSPLLANIYLHLFDQAFLSYCRATGLAAKRVRSADACVILMRGGVKETLKKVKEVLAQRELQLHAEKSRGVDARAGRLDLLGFTLARKRSPKTARVSTVVKPSRKSEQQLRDEGRGVTSRRSHSLPQQEVVERVNRYGRGWGNYFHVHTSTRVFARQRFCLEQRGGVSTGRSGDRARGVAIGGGRRLGSIKSGGCTPYRSMLRIGALACLEVKMIGKPDAGELHVRFDEGGQDRLLRKLLNGHAAGNGRYSQGLA